MCRLSHFADEHLRQDRKVACDVLGATPLSVQSQDLGTGLWVLGPRCFQRLNTAPKKERGGKHLLGKEKQLNK